MFRKMSFPKWSFFVHIYFPSLFQRYWLYKFCFRVSVSSKNNFWWATIYFYYIWSNFFHYLRIYHLLKSHYIKGSQSHLLCTIDILIFFFEYCDTCASLSRTYIDNSPCTKITIEITTTYNFNDFPHQFE